MINMETKSAISYYNPYSGTGKRIHQGDAAYKEEAQSKVLQVADSIVNLSGRFLYRNVEKRVDLMGKIAKALDWGTFAIVGGVQGAVMIDHILPFTIRDTFLHRMTKAITRPSAGFFFGMGLIEGFVELSNLQRTILLQKRLNKRETPLQKLEWLQGRYFSLRNEEANQISEFIDEKLSMLNKTQKALKFQQIADKVLENRFSALKSRITKPLAEKVQEQLGMILNDLKSWNPRVRNRAKIRAEKLMESVSRQAENKIIVHILGLIAIGFTVISMFAALTGIAAGGFFIVMGAFSVSFIAAQFFVEKGTLSREVKRFHRALQNFKLPVYTT